MTLKARFSIDGPNQLVIYLNEYEKNDLLKCIKDGKIFNTDDRTIFINKDYIRFYCIEKYTGEPVEEPQEQQTEQVSKIEEKNEN